MRWLTWCIFTAFVLISVVAERVSYHAFAAQHAPLGNVFNDSPETITNANVGAYTRYAQQAHSAGGDVIVFPEGALGWIFAEINNTRDTMLPFCTHIPAVGQIACGDTSFDWQAQQLSCIARNNSIVAAINTCQVVDCDRSTDPDCPADGRYQYNTDIAFDADGAVLAVYHKSHLFGGSNVFDQADAEPVYFDVKLTGGIVRFGMFICFDIEWRNPGQKLVQLGIRDILFSSWWVNVYGISVANQYQQGWSALYEVNLVAANTGQMWNNGGGIYSAGRVVEYLYNPSANIQTLIGGKLTTESPHRATEADGRQFKADVASYRGPHMRTPATSTPKADICTVFNLTGACVPIGRALGPDTAHVTHGSLQCDASVVVSAIANTSADSYVLYAFEGEMVEPYTPDVVHAQVCGILRCNNAPHCTLTQLNGTTVFQTFGISGKFAAETQVLPLVAVDDGRIVSQQWSSTPTAMWTVVELTRPLFSAALWGVTSSL